MNRNEVADVLSAISAYDRRTIGDPDVIAWHAAIGDLPKDLALDAVVIHHKTSSEFMKPSHLNTLARDIRQDRAQRGLTGSIGSGCRFCDEQGWVIDTQDRYGWAIRCEHDERQLLEVQPGHVPHKTPQTAEQREQSLDIYWTGRREHPVYKPHRRM